MVRLGYACINTVLRAQDVFTNRTLRLAKVKEQGIESAKELGLKNIKDLIPIIKWNEENGIRFFRLSSTIFPFASEPQYGYSLKYAEKELKEAGDLAKRYGHRLTTHPGQFNVLCSPHEPVVERTFKDLACHAEMLDLMGMGVDSVMIIHMGGAYGDKVSSIERFEKNFLKLPENIRNRIVLENDEVSYKVEELLPVCKKLKIPLVLDWHHDRLNPSTNPIQSYLPEIESIWKERGIKPKQHYSESAKGHPNPRTHSDYVARLPPCAPDMDLMIEAKMKEQTVLRICKKYGICPDTKEYPTTEPQALSDDEQLEGQVVLKGQARKKHTWAKKTETGEPKKRKPRAKKEKGEADIVETKKTTKKSKGKIVKTEVTNKRKKLAHGSEDIEEIVEKKQKIIRKPTQASDGDDAITTEITKVTTTEHKLKKESDSEQKTSGNAEEVDLSDNNNDKAKAKPKPSKSDQAKPSKSDKAKSSKSDQAKSSKSDQAKPKPSKSDDKTKARKATSDDDSDFAAPKAKARKATSDDDSDFAARKAKARKSDHRKSPRLATIAQD